MFNNWFNNKPKKAVASEETYPTTRLYRNNQEGVAKETKAFMKEFLDPKRFKYHVAIMFSMSEKDVDALTPQEIEDIKNYAEYGYSRLAVSSLYSPQHQHLLEEDKKGRVDVHKVVRAGVFEGGVVEHDLLHALVAYARSNGESSRPAYDTSKVIPDPEAVGEEMMTHLFWGHSSVTFIERVARGEDPVALLKEFRIKNRGGLDSEPKDQAEIDARVEELVSERESDPVTYAMRVFEEYWRQEFGHAQQSVSFIRTDPAYRKLFEAVCANAIQETPDPLIRFREFQRITGPLLERLRAEK